MTGGSGTITRVEIWVNGALAATATSAPYRFTGNSAAVPDGSYSLVARAYDTAGNVGTSAPVIMSIRNTSPTTQRRSPSTGGAPVLGLAFTGMTRDRVGKAEGASPSPPTALSMARSR